MSLITRKVKAEDIGLPKWAKKVLKERGLKENEVEVFRKGISPEDTKINKGERSTVDYITTKAVDRDGEIVVPKGAILDHYRQNPVVLFGHNYNDLPIGRSLWIKADEKGLISKTQYAKHQKAEDIYQYRKDGFPMAKSIGFIPLSVVEEADFDGLDLKSLGLTKEDLKGASRVFPQWLMLEYSDVPVPSNPEALQLAISKGIITAEEAKEAVDRKAFVIEITEPEKVEKEIVHKPETTENYHHIPVRDAKDFVDDSFKTITLSEDQGIKAVIGKLKSDPDGSTKTQKYLFSVDKWTMEEAQSWVDEHKAAEAEDKKDMLDKRYGPEATVILEAGDNKLSQEVVGAIEKEEDGHEDDSPDTVCDEMNPEKEDVYMHHSSVLNLPKLKSVSGVSGPWNEDLCKDLDIANLEAPPSATIYDIASKWLDCEVKEIYVHGSGVPVAMMGNFLSGLEEALKDFELISVRNLMSNGSESPPTYKVIQLTSETSKDFLVNGMEFYEKEGKRLIISRDMGWYGLDVTAYSTYKNNPISVKVFSDTKRWIAENNLLKGERFDLSGEFIKKTDDTWDSLFLDSKNDKAVKDSVRLINKRGADLANRGLIYMGPPGTGKTLSGRVMMNNVDATFIWVSARDFSYSGAMGGIRYGFNLARELAPTVLFIEDIDNWLHGQATDLMKTEMDGISKSKGVVTVLTSNHPEQLPPALIDRPGRFHDILDFSLPDASIRMKMLKSWAGNIQEKVASLVISETKGFSGAHMYELVAFAKNITDEEECDLEDALLLSLDKLKEQRELIESIKKEPDEIIRSPFSFTDDVESKAGRVLSKKTRTIISDALSGMEKATLALNELVETADSKDEEMELESEMDSTEEEKSEDGVVIKIDNDKEKSGDEIVIKIDEAEEEKVNLIEIDEEKLKSSLTETLTGILRNSKVNVEDMIKETLDRRNGKIF